MTGKQPSDHDEDGQTLVEYGIVIAFFSVAMIAALVVLRTSLGTYYSALADFLGTVL